jgi:hypothetical protein
MKNFFKKFVLLLALPLLSATKATPPPDTNAKVKSSYIMAFTKNIEWPGNYKEGSFVIGILGSSTLIDELNKMAETKKVGLQNIEIKAFNSAASVSKCHLLYVAPEMSSTLKDVLPKIKGQSTLLVTEKQGMTKFGSAINFVVQDNKLKFELNKSNAQKYNLAVGSSLLPFAILVD